MSQRTTKLLLSAALLTVATLFGTASIALGQGLGAKTASKLRSGPAGIVYVESNNPAAGQNAILAFRREANGCLTPLPGSPFLTGGTGTANPDSLLGPDDIDRELIVSPDRKLLFAVNSGSNTIAVFQINADGSLTPVKGSPFPSGGTQPVSLALIGDQLYVANKNQDPGQGQSSTPPNYTGFRVAGNGHLSPIPHSTVTLPFGASPAGVLAAPFGDLLFAVDFGFNVFDPTPFAHLASAIHMYLIQPNGRLTESPSTPLPPAAGPLALGLLAHPSEPVLYVGFPAAGMVGVYTYDAQGQLTLKKTVGNSGSLVCWFAINQAGTFFYTSNNGNNTVSTYSLTGGALNPTEIQYLQLAGPPSSPVELALDPAGRYLYVVGQSNSQSTATNTNGNEVHILAVGTDGKLTELPCSPVALPIPPAAHAHGIVVL